MDEEERCKSSHSTTWFVIDIRSSSQLESSFYVLEPVIEKINERSKPVPAISRFGFRSAKSDWFREYREFFIPSEASDIVFLRSKIAILHTKGFEIMDLMEYVPYLFLSSRTNPCSTVSRARRFPVAATGRTRQPRR